MKTATAKKIEQALDRISKDDSHNAGVVAALKVAVQCLDSLVDQGNVTAPDALNEILNRLR